jgi:hypothetical protein
MIALPPCSARSVLPNGEYKCDQRKLVFRADQVELECRLCICECKGQKA